MRRASFEPGEVQLSPAVQMTDESPSWADPGGLDVEMAMRPGPGWTWAGDQAVVTGPSWGGCREILDFHLRANRYLLAPRAYAGCVLLLETSEQMPGAEYVYRMLMGIGERGMLEQFAAVVVATPKAWTRRWVSPCRRGLSSLPTSERPSFVPLMSTTQGYQRFLGSTSDTPTRRS